MAGHDLLACDGIDYLVERRLVLCATQLIWIGTSWHCLEQHACIHPS